MFLYQETPSLLTSVPAPSAFSDCARVRKGKHGPDWNRHRCVPESKVPFGHFCFSFHWRDYSDQNDASSQTWLQRGKGWDRLGVWNWHIRTVCVCTQLCPIPCDPMGHQAPLTMEFSRQEYWSGLPFLSPGDLPDPGFRPEPLVSPALVYGFFTTVPPESPIYTLVVVQSSSRVCCLTLCDPMDCSTPGLPAPHQLPELAQVHVHCISDAASHLILWRPLLLPSIFPSIRDFSGEASVCIRWPNYWSFHFSISNTALYIK